MSTEHFSLEAIIRPNILALTPYRCARDDYKSGILLDANENALGHSITRSNAKEDGIGAHKAIFDALKAQNGLIEDFLESPLHRYPDPSHPQIKSAYASFRGIPGPDNVFLGVGSDEVIDLLFRVTCTPSKDKVLVCPPTYGMYAVCAQINDVAVVKVPQTSSNRRFTIPVGKILEETAADPSIKMICLTSPGNPTGSLVPRGDVQKLLTSMKFKGLLVIDEAYIDFSDQVNENEPVSAATLIADYPNLVVLQTLSKGFGLAAIRLGLALTSPNLVQILSNTKAPYNVSSPTAILALQALTAPSIQVMLEKVLKLKKGRAWLLEAFAEMRDDLGDYIGGLDANFVMIPVLNRKTGKPDNIRAGKLYQSLAETQGVVVRFRGKEHGCEGCLRVTVGTDEENKTCIEKMKILFAQIE